MSEMDRKEKTPEDYGFHMPDKKDSFRIELNEKSSVKKIFGIVSGKGGVGKSFVTSMLASEMQRRGHRTAVLDGDITGPSQGRAFGIVDPATGDGKYIYPAVTKTGIQVITTNMILDSDETPVIWRGPMVANVLKQFYTDVLWDDVEFMFVDMPPGTSDVPLTIFQSLPLDGIIVVTSPQDLVSMVVEKAVNMASQMNINVIGIAENMSYVKCPKCGEEIKVFGDSHTDEICKKFGLPLLARIPLDARIAQAADAGKIEDLRMEEVKPLCDAVENI
jgi:Mrp family chromosome partitioning ATPase